MIFSDLQNQLNAVRAISEESRAALKIARQKMENIKRKKDLLVREIAAKDHASDERLKAITHDETKFTKAVNVGKTTYAGALMNEWAKLNEFLQFVDPIQNISNLEDDYPILLFPLRLETRFKKVESNGETVDQLWVRVFPDEISIDSFESDLSDAEIRNARSYWLARWKAGKDVDGNRGAWRSLASARGPGRAFWLTNNYVPLNLADEPEKVEGEIILAIGTEDVLTEPELGTIITYWQTVWKAGTDNVALSNAWNKLVSDVEDEERAKFLVKVYKPSNISDIPPVGLTREQTTVRVEFVVFPKTDEMETKLHAWSQPPATTILPERFVFLAYQNGEQAISQLGNLVPPKLIMGPDPAAEEGEDFRLATQGDADINPSLHEGDLIFSENMRWMFDFDEAVAKGMGFKIDLTSEQAESGFERVFVLGVKLSADAERGQGLLEELFQHHQYSSKGMSIIRQGTPTNNTEENGSGYSWRHDPDDSFDIYFGESDSQTDPTDWFSKCDGRWMAELLGIDPDKLRTIENYYGTDIRDAKAMQQALWPTTMGHFMNSMMNPVFSEDVIEQTRKFFTRYVSGCGNLPAIRVGNQPYGILPATNYTQMEWFRKTPSDNPPNELPIFHIGKGFLSGLYRILLDIDRTWTELHTKAAYLGKKGDPHQILLDIVGLHPDSAELYKRYGNSLKQLHNIYNAWGFLHNPLFDYYPTSYAAAAALLEEYGYSIDKINPEPDIFKKSFFNNAFILKGDRIDKGPDSEINPIGPYTPDGKNYIRWLIEAAEQSHDRLRIQDGFANGKPPTALLYLLLYHALDLSYIDTSLKLHLSKGVFDEEDVRRAYIEPDFIHIEEGNETESRWKYLYKTEEAITGDPYVQLGQYIPQHIDELKEAAVFRDVLAGLKKLEHVPTARLERLLMEHIDTVSYRYDAWMLGYLHLQLEQMRGLKNSGPDSSPKRGVYLGAYGWLEDLRPENKELTPVSLPDELNEVFNPQSDLVDDVSNAGYILAPSVNHAVTAAVLRNGHLSNDSPEDKEELKIKLSSNRVRLALQIIEGIQGGQSLSALLGYQFERKLHDSAIAEVDAFIFDLRNAFPLVAKKFKETTPEEDPDYKSIDQIEAKNVIDGVAFLEHIEKTGIKTYPFGLDEPPYNFGLQDASPDKQRAINQAVLKLIELNDAVADLAMAESVHQAVMGNYERAAATLDTYSKGNFPPTPDVIQTPRSGFQLTHRVALQFKSGLSNNLDVDGVTPRMVAEPAIQDWLKGIMPDVDDIVCVIRYIGSTSGVETKKQISLSDLGLAHIDALYLLNIDSDQVMSALDDLIMHHALTDLSLHMDQDIVIEYTSKIDSNKITVFEMTSLIASLRALLLRSKPLSAADSKLPNEAASENEQTVNLDAVRVQPIIDKLAIIRTHELADYITGLDAIIAIDNTDSIVAGLDRLMADIAVLFIQVGRFGLRQTGIGFVYQWQQSMHAQIVSKLDELITRWENRETEYDALRGEYLADSTLPDEEKFTILTKAELKISSQPTIPRPNTPEKYFEKINGTVAEDGRWREFQDMLNNTIRPILNVQGLTSLITDIQNMAAQLPPFDIIGIDIEEQLKQVRIFATDLKNAAENLKQEMEHCETTAQELLDSVAIAGDSMTKVERIRGAAKAIFGDDFVIVPEFSLDETHGTEWQNTMVKADHSLRYLHGDLDLDFPMDDWLYGISRVREKLYHVENVLMHIEGFTGDTLSLMPSQFPYRENDYWVGMQFPEKKDGTEEPFTIDEDKLLFTSIYSEAFDPTKPQCGLLLDEWTEVIPSKDETLGLSFHYDQPNSEPPQTLLLTTPSNFTGSWQWEDLANTLHEALDMAKKRAVEPDHVDTTVYSRFLPPIVSLASPLPLTAMLNLALNNNVFFSKVSEDE